MTVERRRFRLALVVGAAAVTLSGCQLDAGVNVVLDRDGAGEMTIALTMDTELAERARGSDLDIMESIRSGVAGDRDWDAQGSDEQIVLSTQFDDADELLVRSRRLADGLNAAELAPLDPLSLDVTGDAISVTGRAGLDVTPNVAELGLTRETAVSSLSESVDYEVTMQFPGEVLTASDGGSVDGTKVTWAIPAGQDVVLQATAKRPALIPVWAWAAAGLGLVVAGLVLVRRRRRTG